MCKKNENSDIRKAWYKQCNTWLLILNVIFAISNLLILIFNAPREISKTLDFDYMGVIVGSFSLLITLLVGWNIFSVIDVKNLKNDMEENKAEVERKLNELNKTTQKVKQHLNDQEWFKNLPPRSDVQ